ncbi:TIGR02678 family protein [Metabacillus arenae]|uniref:TIGR02678 family protein n=1 Tax=Metabacillus arenae TaxID=2771434 RepID=A0A926N8P1_9BACI|nr:TIGR02678 family protein [Metabacillus arenae]MBD1379522.1 TIGR02678 family protein [Metabacillus arenae]
MEQAKGFDEKTQEAMEILFENFWIIRSEAPEIYQLVREREHALRRYISEKFGFRLIVHQYFIKLEKIPVKPESWMGIQKFSKPMDYSLFCCLLAFLESKSIDEQFLLSELCEDLQAIYPGTINIDWTNYEHRKSLIRVLSVAKDCKLLKLIDGEIEDFGHDKQQEVLYEVPVVSRYFMRSYPKDLFKFQSIDEILDQEWQNSSTEMRRQRVYRKLFLSPVTYREVLDDSDFYYLRNFRNRIREDIEEHTDYQFELYKNAALLTMNEKKSRFTLFPDQKAVMDIVMHLSGIIRENLGQFPPNEFGILRLTSTDFEMILKKCVTQFKSGWSKSYREAPLRQLAKELLEVMGEWKMADVDEETDMILIYPLVGRIVGKYPSDYDWGEET